MNKIPLILENKNNPLFLIKPLPVIGITKHMCGGATDLTLNALLSC